MPSILSYWSECAAGSVLVAMPSRLSLRSLSFVVSSAFHGVTILILLDYYEAQAKLGVQPERVQARAERVPHLPRVIGARILQPHL